LLVFSVVFIAGAYIGDRIWGSESWDWEFTWANLGVAVAIGALLAIAASVTGVRQQLQRDRLEHLLDAERVTGKQLRDRDETKNVFLQAVSHELRTPLTSILGFAITLRDGATELTPAHRAMIDTLTAEAVQMDGLLGDLLDLHRLTSGQVMVECAETDIAQLVATVTENVSRRSRRDIGIETQTALATVDARKVERIIENLLTNAVKYTPEDCPVDVSVVADDDSVLISVDDHGPGIPNDLRKSIFEPFNRGDGKNGHIHGSGVGLSIVDRFARLHGGRAWVEARTGGGSSFRVQLPNARSAT
jgi:signal transduction histidine kinase